MSQRTRKLVVAALVRRDDRVLMSQRKPDQSLPLHWEFPGGKIEPGESPEQALIREIDEELGCQVTVQDIEQVIFHAYADFDLYMLLYRCAVTAGEPSAVDVADVRWVPVTELPGLLLPPADVPIARRLATQGKPPHR